MWSTFVGSSKWEFGRICLSKVVFFLLISEFVIDNLLIKLTML